MKQIRSGAPVGRVARLAAFALVVLGCERPMAGPGAPGTTAPPSANQPLAAVVCQADVHRGTIGCAPAPAPATDRRVSYSIIYGGQGSAVNVAFPTATYVGSHLVAVATIQNLLAQPIGTDDGVTIDSGGVELFFQSGPTVTGGTGAVTIANATGAGLFTAPGQPFFRYPELIPANGTSSARTWDFVIGAGVTNFTFVLYVQARMPSEAAPTQASHVFSQSLSLGEFHSCGRQNGVVGLYCWGDDNSGQLGVSNVLVADAHPTPFPVLFAAPAPVIASLPQTSRASYSCALSTSGAAYCWGKNSNGQLGNGTTTDAKIPVAVAAPGGVTFTQLAQGTTHTCGLTGVGGVYCWGSNATGEIGDGTTSQHPLPTAIPLPTGVVASQIVAGDSPEYTCALSTAGSEYCWGADSTGQLGDGTTTNQLTPTAVQMPTGVAFASVAASTGASCALSTAGLAYCWGQNSDGELGDSTVVGHIVPAPVQMPSGVAFASISTGNFSVCALSTAGNAYCWGANGQGQVGDGSTTTRLIPTAVLMPIGVAFAQVRLGGFHACAVSGGGTPVPFCWGDDNWGELGDGNTRTHKSAPVQVTAIPGGANIVGFALGNDHTCAMTSAGGVDCWGTNESGELGQGTGDNGFEESNVPLLIFQPLVTFQAGGQETCALTAGALPYCWGLNANGQIGDGTTTNRLGPTPVSAPTGVQFTQIAPALMSTCGLALGGTVYCWGDNSFGEVGDGTMTQRLTPTALGGSPPFFARLTANFVEACGLTSAGAAYCWGNNQNGQLGDGTTTNRLTPTAVSMPTGVAFSQVTGGGSIAGTNYRGFTCALSTAATVYCWGYNGFGQFGNGTTSTTPAPSPTLIAMPTGVTPVQVAAGNNHACVLASSGAVYCAGSNAFGQIGDGTTTTRSTLTKVNLPTGVIAVTIALGSLHSCAVSSSGLLYCWGNNANGEIGDGTITNRPTPTAVINP